MRIFLVHRSLYLISREVGVSRKTEGVQKGGGKAVLERIFSCMAGLALCI